METKGGFWLKNTPPPKKKKLKKKLLHGDFVTVSLHVVGGHVGLCGFGINGRITSLNILIVVRSYFTI